MPEVTSAVELMYLDSAGQLRSLPTLTLEGTDAPREHAVIVYRKADGTLAVSSIDVLLEALGVKLDALRAKEPKDFFSGGEVLAEWTSTAEESTKTFSFAFPVHLVWVRCDKGDGRADPFGGTPDATRGIVCESNVAVPITVLTSSVKVFAPAGTRVNVVGYRYA